MAYGKLGKKSNKKKTTKVASLRSSKDKKFQGHTPNIRKTSRYS